MTIENEITYGQELYLNSINQEPSHLYREEVIDEKSDLSISCKMVDKEGNTILLIEAAPCCIDEGEQNRYVQGCFIRRFEYVGYLLFAPFTSILEKFIRTFITSVRFNMVPTADNKYKTSYHYVWAEKSEDEKCIIAALLDLQPIFRVEGLIIYKGDIPQ